MTEITPQCKAEIFLTLIYSWLSSDRRKANVTMLLLSSASVSTRSEIRPPNIVSAKFYLQSQLSPFKNICTSYSVLHHDIFDSSITCF